MVRCHDRAFDKLIRSDKLIHQVTEGEVCTFTDKSASIPILLQYEHWRCPKHPLLRKPLNLLTCTAYRREIRRQLRFIANYNEMAIVPGNEKKTPKQATKAQAAARDTVINV